MQRIQRHQTKEADQVDQRRQKQTNCCRRQFRQNRYFLQKLRLFMIFLLYLFKQVTIDSTVVVNVMPLLPPQSQEISQSENFHEAIFYVIETLLRQYHPRKKNVRLLDVIHHENIKKLASLRFLGLNQKTVICKMQKRTNEHMNFFLSCDHLLNKHPANQVPQLVLQLLSFLKSDFYYSHACSKNITLTVQ